MSHEVASAGAAEVAGWSEVVVRGGCDLPPEHGLPPLVVVAAAWDRRGPASSLTGGVDAAACRHALQL